MVFYVDLALAAASLVGHFMPGEPTFLDNMLPYIDGALGMLIIYQVGMVIGEIINERTKPSRNDPTVQ